jgi:hypothetical protein
VQPLAAAALHVGRAWPGARRDEVKRRLGL